MLPALLWLLCAQLVPMPHRRVRHPIPPAEPALIEPYAVHEPVPELPAPPRGGREPLEPLAHPSPPVPALAPVPLDDRTSVWLRVAVTAAAMLGAGWLWHRRVEGRAGKLELDIRPERPARPVIEPTATRVESAAPTRRARPAGSDPDVYWMHPERPPLTGGEASALHIEELRAWVRDGLPLADASKLKTECIPANPPETRWRAWLAGEGTWEFARAPDKERGVAPTEAGALRRLQMRLGARPEARR